MTSFSYFVEEPLSTIGFISDIVGDLGGILALNFLWEKYRNSLPKIKSAVVHPFYSEPNDDQLELHLTFYPGSRPLSISEIKIKGFDISVVSKEVSEKPYPLGLLGTFNPTFCSSRCPVNWEIPSSIEHPEPVYVGLFISQHNLDLKKEVSIPVQLFTNRLCQRKIKHTALKKDKPSIHH